MIKHLYQTPMNLMLCSRDENYEIIKMINNNIIKN